MIRPARLRTSTALAVTLLAQSVPAATLTTQEPRAFGYSVGDIVERRLRLQGTLPDYALPKPGRRGGLELRSVGVERLSGADGPVHEIRLHYQVFTAPLETRALLLPALTLASGGETLTVPEYRVYVSPLVPPGFASDSALGELRPDVAARPVDSTATRTRLAGFAGAALLLALWLAWRQFGDLLSTRRRGPFATAWQELRRDPTPTPDTARQALRRLHRAFDAAAGTTLFVEGLDAFLAARPEYEPQRAAIGDFFARSRRTFFTAAGSAETADLAAVLALAAACRAIERSHR